MCQMEPHSAGFMSVRNVAIVFLISELKFANEHFIFHDIVFKFSQRYKKCTNFPDTHARMKHRKVYIFLHKVIV